MNKLETRSCYCNRTFYLQCTYILLTKYIIIFKDKQNEQRINQFEAIVSIITFICLISYIFLDFTGSSVGRFIGEVMAHWCPEGIRGKMIIPGAYSLVGAATFSGAVTHTVSPAVIVFELTGHLGHLLPCMVWRWRKFGQQFYRPYSEIVSSSTDINKRIIFTFVVM